jgi:ribose-phosphate pyrophosphokinase
MIKLTYRSHLQVVTTEITEFLTFSGGEEHVRLAIEFDPGSPITITARLTSSQWIMRLFLVTDALDGMGANRKDIGLVIPYLPYARQDRVCSPGDAFSLRAFVRLIAAQGYSQIACLDIHNGESLKLFWNHDIRVHNQTSTIFSRYFKVPEITHVVAPDKGAGNRVSAWHGAMKADNPELKYLQMDKKRNPATGEITGLSLPYLDHADKLTGAFCLIVDDICDGGRTFIEAAKLLKGKGAKRVELFVSHGIFSKRFDELLSPEAIDFIHTTDSICVSEHPRLRVFKL